MIELRRKKILVTGGSGFLGQRIVDGLFKWGVPKANISTPDSKQFDLRRWEDCLKAAQGQDVVFHMAAFTSHILDKNSIQGQIFYENLIMGAHMLEAARVAGVQKIITSGSSAEYPESAPSPLKEDDLWLGRPPEIDAYYGLSKKLLIVQGQGYRRQYGLNAIHLIFTNMFGPGERPESGYAVPSLIQRIIDAKRSNSPFVKVWGTGRTVRDLLFVDDAVRGIRLAAETYHKEDPVNIGSGVGMSIKELVENSARVANFSGEIHWDVTKPEGRIQRVLDGTRAKREFGFVPSTPFEEALRTTIKWHEKLSG